MDINKFNEDWSKNADDYIGPGGTQNQIGTRYEQFGEFLKLGSPIEMPEVGMGAAKTAPSFGNGRHRFVFFRDHGMATMPVAVDPDSAEAIRKRYGVEAPQQAPVSTLPERRKPDSISATSSNAYVPKVLPDKLRSSPRLLKEVRGRARKDFQAAADVAEKVHRAVSRAAIADEPIGSAGKKRLIESIRASEQKQLRKWAAENGLMLDSADFESKWEEGGRKSGMEHDVYLDDERGVVMKRNVSGVGLAFGDYFGYFQRNVLFNKFFPEVPVTFRGFVEKEGETEGVNVLMPVMEQPVVEIDDESPLTQPEIDAFMNGIVDKKGNPIFVKNGSSRYLSIDGTIEISDMDDENVVRTVNGDIVVIDNDINLRAPVAKSAFVAAAASTPEEAVREKFPNHRFVKGDEHTRLKSGESVILKMYHATRRPTQLMKSGKFNSRFLGETYGAANDRLGWYFSSEYHVGDEGREYVGSKGGVLSFYIRMDNPLVVDTAELPFIEDKKGTRKVEELMESGGHDGIIAIITGSSRLGGNTPRTEIQRRYDLAVRKTDDLYRDLTIEQQNKVDQADDILNKWMSGNSAPESGGFIINKARAAIDLISKVDSGFEEAVSFEQYGKALSDNDDGIAASIWWAIVPTDNVGQIKSAEFSTYDKSGNVIPLSQRFNPERPEITAASPINQEYGLFRYSEQGHRDR